MTISRVHGSLCLAICAASLTLGCLRPALGQEAPPEQRDPFATHRVSIEFPGGTVEEYVEAIEESLGQSWVVVMPEASDVPLPAIKLTGVPWDAAVEVLHEYEHRGDDRVTGLRVRGGAIYVVEAEELGRTVRKLRPRVWSLESLLGPEMSAEDILAAVETALSTFDASSPIRFHVETSLLIVRADEEQIQAIEQVLNALDDTIRAVREEREEGTLAEQYEFEISKAGLEVRRALERLRLSQQRLEELEKQVGQGLADETHLMEARQEVRMREIDLREAELHVEHLERIASRLGSDD